MSSQVSQYIQNRFGSKKGLVAAIRHQTLYWLGLYGDVKRISPSRAQRLIFICSGNICRSPFAEACARELGFEAQSYGLHCRGGDPADPRAQEFSRNLGINLDDHVTRPIADYTARSGDLLVCMEPGQIEDTKAQATSGQEITLLGLWHPRPRPYIHDPFSSNQAFFERCEQTIFTATKRLVTQIRASHA